MAAEILLVPIHLDALYLKKDRSVVEAMADFSRLPYCDGEHDINPDVANLSEEILSQPFEDRDLQLQAGVHLHWALPDALTKGVISEKDGTNFPAVPNRWLVTRSRKEADGTERIECQWIIESDYLYPDDLGAQSGSITIPFCSEGNRPPFRYLGRRMPLSSWAKAATLPETEYLGKLGYRLTAVGYEYRDMGLPESAHGRGHSEPTFAAFYPNCLSVFGFHDNTPPPSLQGVQYDVIGWYSDPQQDCLYSKALQQAFAAKEKYKALEEVYRWVVEDPRASTLPPFPTRTICYSHLTFATNDPPDDLPQKRKVAVACGNTGTEALSTYLADLCARKSELVKQISKPEDVEDQLEAIHLAGQLEGRTLDIGLKFREARHNKEFNGVMAGTLWTIRLEKTASGQANAHEAATYAEDTLPRALATQLDQLNVCQKDFDRDCDEIESLRKQLFADWYKYMLCVYPPEGHRDQYPNHDQVKYFIEKNDLIPLRQRIGRNNLLNFRRNQTFAKLYQAVAEIQLLIPADIKDWAKFQNRFHQPRPETVEQIKEISQRLSDRTKSFLSTKKITLDKEDQQQTITDLNGLLRDPRLSESKSFSGVALSGEAQSLAAQLKSTNPNIEDWPYPQLLRFNRLLLEAIFPEEIAKSAPYTLKSVPAPRYWQPNEPVVLIVDEEHQTVRPSPRDVGLRKEEGLLRCDVIELKDAAIDLSWWNPAPLKIGGFAM